MKRVRVAVAGAGMVSRHHLVAWSRCAEAEVVGIADPSPGAAASRAQEFSLTAVFDDAAKMLEVTRPDAIDIAASHEAHGTLCDLAAERGVAILCQKPLAPTLDAARTIAAGVGDRVRLMVHENWRHRPYYRQIHDWSSAGAIGQLRHIVLVARSSGLLAGPDGNRPSLVRQPMLAGLDRLMIGEGLVHHLDVMTWLAGGLAMRAACVRHDVPAVRGESAATMLLEDADGRTAIIDGDLAVPGASARIEDRLEIIGTEGSIRLDGETLTLVRSDAARSEIRYDLDDAYQRSYDAAIAHFAHALLHDLPFETPADVHLRVLALVEDAYRLASR